MVRRVFEENTSSRARGKFVFGSGGYIRIAGTAENTKMVIGGSGAKQDGVGTWFGDSFCG